uniref:Immunoglobulin subtype domain-containing protein n=1 Tax=Esox lucius TaxID=8010 RepID=A0AAY5KG14_ESOLU
MVTSLLICGVLLGVGCVIVHSELSVCEEEDGDLRIDCHLEPRANQINSYEFSLSTGTVETVINTNVSGSSPDVHYRDRSYVEHLDPHGYRLRLSAGTHTVTHINNHPETTFICKISKKIASQIIQKGGLLPCSAERLLVRTCCCLLSLLFPLWSLAPY